VQHKSIKVASAEYETTHGLKTYPCIGTIYEKDGTYVLHERIQVGVDGLGNPAQDEHSKTLSLEQAQGVLRDWQRLDIADVFLIPWE
jgi:hypothetical protein